MPQFKKAKSSNWIESDQFGDFSGEKSISQPNKSGAGGRKRPRENNNTLKNTPAKSFSVPQLPNRECDEENEPPPLVKNSSFDPTELWIHRHVPSSVEDLAVNKKKIDEVRSCLQELVSTGQLIMIFS